MGQLFWVEKSTFLSLFHRVLELLIALDLQIFCYLSLRKTHVCFDVRLLKLIRKGIIQKTWWVIHNHWILIRYSTSNEKAPRLL